MSLLNSFLNFGSGSNGFNFNVNATVPEDSSADNAIELSGSIGVNASSNNGTAETTTFTVNVQSSGDAGNFEYLLSASTQTTGGHSSFNFDVTRALFGTVSSDAPEDSGSDSDSTSSSDVWAPTSDDSGSDDSSTGSGDSNDAPENPLTLSFSYGNHNSSSNLTRYVARSEFDYDVPGSGIVHRGSSSTTQGKGNSASSSFDIEFDLEDGLSLDAAFSISNGEATSVATNDFMWVDPGSIMSETYSGSSNKTNSLSGGIEFSSAGEDPGLTATLEVDSSTKANEEYHQIDEMGGVDSSNDLSITFGGDLEQGFSGRLQYEKSVTPYTFDNLTTAIITEDPDNPGSVLVEAETTPYDAVQIGPIDESFGGSVDTSTSTSDQGDVASGDGKSADTGTDTDGGEDEFVFVAALSSIRWHHLIPRQFEPYLPDSLKNSNAEYGRLMTHADHVELHNLGWNDDWQLFFDKNPAPTKEQVVGHLNKMLDPKNAKYGQKYAATLKKAGVTKHSYWQWNKLSRRQKAGHYTAGLRAAKVLVAVAGILGGAGTAEAAFSPLFAATNEAARNDYKLAVAALQDENYTAATRHLFGDSDSAILDNDPRGFVTRFFAEQIKGNALSRNAAIAAFANARAAFIEYTAKLQRDRNLNK